MQRQDANDSAVTGDDDPLVGTLVAGRYRIARRLGEGGMGTVYLAVHEALRKSVALKVLSGRGSSDKSLVARFEREAVAAANLRHPNIAEATDFGRLPDGTFYLVMEYVEGGTLRALLRASPGGLSPARALGILRQVAAALGRAHAMGIVHRDLKPENVIVFDRRDATDVVKVIDFGIARVRDAFGMGGTALTAAGAVFGTPEYMAPEQVLGRPADARADQYAFGVAAFELFTGHVPFTGFEMSQILMKHVNAPIPSALDVSTHLPAAADVVLSRLLAKRPEDRYPTIEEAWQALESAFAIRATSTTGTLLIDARASAPSLATPAMTPAGGTTVSLRGQGAGQGAGYGAAAPAVTGPVSLGSSGVSGVQSSPGGAGSSAVQAAAVRPTPSFDTLIELVQKGTKDRTVRLGAAGAGGALLLLLVVLVVWRAASSSLPGNVEDALDRWEDGAYDAAEPALRAGLNEKPSLATEPAFYGPLLETVRDDKARGVLSRLMSTSALGRSAPLAARLADTGLEDAGPARNGALKLLRGRLDLLPRELGARIALRDADDCAALERAVNDLSGAGPDAEDDAKRHRDGHCRDILRREELCGCPPPGSVRPRSKRR